MPLPTPNKGESQSDYVSRCIDFVISEGGQPNTEKGREIAAGMCHSQWDQKQKKRERIKDGKLQVLQQLSANLVFNEEQTDLILKPLEELKADKNGLLRLPRSTLIVADGLYNNIWHPSEEAEKSYMTWNRQPFILDHKHEILTEIGFMEMPMYNAETKKLSAIPVINLNTAHGKDAVAHIQTRLMAGKAPETSIGFWCTETLEKVEMLEGEEKTVARGWEGDHNSLVYRGACSPSDGAGIGLKQNKLNYMEENKMEENDKKQENKEEDGITANKLVIDKTPKEPQISREDFHKMMQDEIKKASEEKEKKQKLGKFKEAWKDKKYDEAEALAKELGLMGGDDENKEENLKKLIKDEIAKSQSHRTTPTRDTMQKTGGKPEKGTREYYKALARTGKAIVEFQGRNPNTRLDLRYNKEDYDEVPEWMIPDTKEA